MPAEIDNPPAPTPAPTPPAPPARKVVFDSQEDFEATLTERTERAVRAKLRELGIAGPQDAEELRRLREVEAERARKAEEDKGNYQKAMESLRTEYGQKEESLKTVIGTLEQELRKDRIDNAIIFAASGKAVNPGAVAKLLHDRIKLDPDTRQPIVYGEDGKPEYRAGKPLTVQQFVEEYLVANPWLRAPAGGDPAGARGGGEADDSNANPGDDLTALKAKAEAAQKVAVTSPSAANVTAAHQAKRAFEEALKKKK